jgi:hypothetical protein
MRRKKKRATSHQTQKKGSSQQGRKEVAFSQKESAIKVDSARGEREYKKNAKIITRAFEEETFIFIYEKKI